jgi:Asp/Glu/Hydantoin racemase
VPDSLPIVTLISATPEAVPPVVKALTHIRPIRVLNQLDEALLSEIERRDGLTRQCIDRMAAQLTLAADAGSAVILTTCNAYSVAVLNELRPALPPTPPIVIIDELMIRHALQHASFTVVGTVGAGLDSQRALIEALAAERVRRGGPASEVTYVLRTDAFAALTSGDPEEHDRIISCEIHRALESSEVVVLAQASMARVVPLVSADLRDRVLASPRLAAEEVDRLLSHLNGGSGSS